MRGKPGSMKLNKNVLGLIPAHAGKTRSSMTSSMIRQAHPRACGENGDIDSHGISPIGSSPRMRGKRCTRVSHVSCGRLIPAHAGKTSRPVSAARASPAHPRACGENTERSGVLTLRSVRSWKTLSFPSSLKVTHCRTFVQLSLSSIRL